MTDSPSQALKKFKSNFRLTHEQIASGVAKKHHSTYISAGTVNEWLNHDQPVGPKHRIAFFKFVRETINKGRKPDPVLLYNHWVDKFEISWAHYAANTNNYNIIIRRHHKWIKERYRRPLMGEDFPLSKIYVPIKLTAYGMRTGVEEMDQVFEEKDLIKFAATGNFTSSRKSDQKIRWIFVKGGPGSGKSALALSIASALTNRTSVATVFLRGAHIVAAKSSEISNGNSSISDAVPLDGFFETFRKSSKKRMVLIIDGLDEIGKLSARNERSILDILDGIRTQAEVLAEAGKSFCSLVFGRDTLTEISAKSFKENVRLFEMGDLSGLLGDNPKTSHRYDNDRRKEWWQGYIKAKGFDPDDSIPKFLSEPEHSLYTLSREPLLSFLITRSAWPSLDEGEASLKQLVERIDAFSENKNRNEIYADIVNRVRTGSEWKEEISDNLPQSEFLKVMQNMALATWHNGTMRAGTVEGIRQVIQDERVSKAFNRLLFDLGNEGASSLLTAFYYRFEDRQFEPGSTFDVGDFEVEFTHKTFAEFLVSTFLFDQCEALLEADAAGIAEEEMAELVRRFISTVLAGDHNPEIAQFVLDEARLRFQSRDWEFWKRAKNMTTRLSFLRDIGSVRDRPWLSQVSTVERLQRAGQLLLLFWGCLNRARYEVTGDRTSFDRGEFGFQSYDLQAVSSSYTLGEFDDGNIIGDIAPESFFSAALCGIQWTGAEMPGMYLNGGEVFGSNFSKGTFDGGVWNGTQIKDVSLEECNLKRIRFQNGGFLKVSIKGSPHDMCEFQSFVFQDTDIDASSLSLCEFRYVHFIDCTFSGVSFCRSSFEGCEFVTCKFIEPDFEAVLFDETLFRQCTFKGIRKDDSNFDTAKFEDCSGHYI